MNNKSNELIERAEKTRNILLTARTVLWTIAGVIIFVLFIGMVIKAH